MVSNVLISGHLKRLPATFSIYFHVDKKKRNNTSHFDQLPPVSISYVPITLVDARGSKMKIRRL